MDRREKQEQRQWKKKKKQGEGERKKKEQQCQQQKEPQQEQRETPAESRCRLQTRAAQGRLRDGEEEPADPGDGVAIDAQDAAGETEKGRESRGRSP